VQHFFTVYKTLEQKPVEIRGWAGAADARRLVGEAQRSYANAHGPTH
jgi:inorganic pyrophosphatase